MYIYINTYGNLWIYSMDIYGHVWHILREPRALPAPYVIPGLAARLEIFLTGLCCGFPNWTKRNQNLEAKPTFRCRKKKHSFGTWSNDLQILQKWMIIDDCSCFCLVHVYIDELTAGKFQQFQRHGVSSAGRRHPTVLANTTASASPALRPPVRRMGFPWIFVGADVFFFWFLMCKES